MNRLLIVSDERSAIPAQRLAVLARLAQETCPLSGDMAELGVYRGGSARVICAACPHKLLHLFDTFAGLPADDDDLQGFHRQGQFAAELGEVQSYLAGLKVTYHVGTFPNMPLPDARFSLIHLDADLYQSTTAALAYFWPRMVRGGALVLDDYRWHHCPGVARAVEEAGLAAQVDVEVAHQGVLRK
jgi:hypothetical protein